MFYNPAFVVWQGRVYINHIFLNFKLYFMKAITLIIISLFISMLSYSQAEEFPLNELVYIGKYRVIKSPFKYFETKRENVYVIIDEGTYFSDLELYVEGKNIIIEGRGKVNIYCKKLYSNVMWITGSNIIVKNIHMKHYMPGEIEGQNCTGRVLAFDNASNITVENCDLNGCGLAGLHDNMGNSNILIKNNYIHNNSLGSYTDINGGVWQKAIDNHPVFKFENNRIENNGSNRIKEKD